MDLDLGARDRRRVRPGGALVDPRLDPGDDVGRERVGVLGHALFAVEPLHAPDDGAGRAVAGEDGAARLAAADRQVFRVQPELSLLLFGTMTGDAGGIEYRFDVLDEIHRGTAGARGGRGRSGGRRDPGFPEPEMFRDRRRQVVVAVDKHAAEVSPAGHGRGGGEQEGRVDPQKARAADPAPDGGEEDRGGEGEPGDDETEVAVDRQQVGGFSGVVLVVCVGPPEDRGGGGGNGADDGAGGFRGAGREAPAAEDADRGQERGEEEQGDREVDHHRVEAARQSPDPVRGGRGGAENAEEGYGGGGQIHRDWSRNSRAGYFGRRRRSIQFRRFFAILCSSKTNVGAAREPPLPFFEFDLVRPGVNQILTVYHPAIHR